VPKIRLEQAEKIINAALKHGAEIKCAPLSVAVLDDGGHLVAFRRQDNSGILRFEIAVGKAYGTQGMGRSSSALAAVAEQRPQFVQSLMAASHGRLVPVAGGVLIRGGDGTLIAEGAEAVAATERDE
jgi:uncharacterized protein GlcG (DUF336 family)